MQVEYPQYPLPSTNRTPKGTYPKLPLSELMQIYDELTGLGVYLVPKQHDKKIPVWKYWVKGAPDVRDRAVMLQEQKRPDVSGWNAVCGLRSNRLVVLDFDTAEIEKYDADPALMYEYVQLMSPSGFVLGSPANGVHVWYRLPEDFEMIGNITPPVRGIDVRGDGGQVVTLGGFNRYDNTPEDNVADKKGVPDGHTGAYTKLPGGDYSHIPLMSAELYEWIKSKKRKKSPPANTTAGENFGKTEIGSRRVENHFKQTNENRERIVIECLEAVLSRWDVEKSYEEWTQLWMSAHQGTHGSPTVRDFIMGHPNVYWRDGDDGKFHFKQAWDTYENQEDGYTVASVFWLARQNGWLTKTGYEIDDELCELINVQYVSEWVDTLDDIPRRLLLVSQTGSGKTYNIKNLYERLGEPKTVVFVPSIKLATELAMTLINTHELPATLYINPETGQIIPVEDMENAKILVTTLQTFATKLDADMSEYGLVYVEESDQLFSQFARGGGGHYGSHVTQGQAASGFAVIRAAMEHSGVCWCVDATMSQITYYVAEALRASHTVRVVKNTNVTAKSPVTMLPDKGMAYQEVLKSLEAGEKVVVCADTAGTAEEVYRTMEGLGALEGKKAILITRHTERQPIVHRFMEDVNTRAAEYDLVCYNSVMATGVSITGVRPDKVVQICSYLTPRVNLQMLNRYRKQVEVFCYYRLGENLYARNAEQILADAERTAWIEGKVCNIPVVTRNNDAMIREKVASISVGDAELQERAPREFYIQLLREDGRHVTHTDAQPVARVIKNSIKGVREAKAEFKAQIAANWYTVPPIDRYRQADFNYTDLEVAMGETHALIERVLRGNIPEDVDPATVYERVHEFRSVAFALSSFIQQDKALKRTEEYLSDKGRAITTLAANVTLIEIVSMIHHLYDSLTEVLTDEIVSQRAAGFLAALAERKEAYDIVIQRKAQKFDQIWAKHDTDVDRAVAYAKIILKKIGLKQRSQRSSRVGGVAEYTYSIVNADNALEFLSWRNADMEGYEPVIDFTTAQIEGIIAGRKDAAELYREMSEDQRAEVTRLMVDEEYTDFPTAVYTVYEGDECEY